MLVMTNHGSTESNRIFGLSAALVTPFSANGGIDLRRLVRHADWVLHNGCDSLTVLGTTGEGFSIGLRERAAMLGAIVGSGIDPGEKVYAAVAASAIADAAEQARLALGFDVCGLLFTPPFYLKDLDEDGLYAWFCQTFDAVGSDLRGVILYNIPGQTAVPLSVDLVTRLRQAYPDAIVGVKDSSGDKASAGAYLAAHGDIAILIGDERLLAGAMVKGAQGSICGLANFAPALLRGVIHDGQDDPRVQAAVDLVLRYPIMPAVKALVAHRHGDPEFALTRPPLVDLSPDQAKELVQGFEAILASSGGA